MQIWFLKRFTLIVIVMSICDKIWYVGIDIWFKHHLLDTLSVIGSLFWWK